MQGAKEAERVLKMKYKHRYKYVKSHKIINININE